MANVGAVPKGATPGMGVAMPTQPSRADRSLATGESSDSDVNSREGVTCFYRQGNGLSGTCDPGLAAYAKDQLPLKRVVPTQKDLETLRRALSALVVASGLSAWITSHGKFRRRRYRLILQQKLKFIETKFRSEPHHAMGELKKFSHHCREVSLGVSPNLSILGVLLPKYARNHFLRSPYRTERFFQLSLLGRALPMGNSIVADRALQKFCKITERDAPCSALAEEVLSDLYGVDTIVSFLKENPPELLKFKFHSPGSSADSTRKDGGYEASLRKAVKACAKPASVEDAQHIFNQMKNEKVVDYRRFCAFRPGLPFADRTGVSSKRLRNFSIPFPPPTVGRIVTIPEYGFKCRIVQCLDTSDVFFGHLHRDRLWPLLTRLRQVRSGLQPDERILFKNSYRSNDRKVYSMDLSNATDNMSRQSLGFMCDFLGVPKTSVYVDRLQTKKGFVFPVNRGTSMGAPCSWIVLSLVHYVVCRRVSRQGGDFSIRGDDLIAYWTSAQFDHYIQLMNVLGFEINLKKSFVHDSLGVFCERLYELDQFGVLVQNKSVISLRRFSRLPSDRDKEGKFALLSCNPQLISSIDGIRDTFLRCKVRKDLIRFVKRRLPIKGKDFDFLQNIPAELGGFGLAELDRPLTDEEVNLFSWVSVGKKNHFSSSLTIATTESLVRNSFLDHFRDTYFEPKYFTNPAHAGEASSHCEMKFSNSLDILTFMGSDGVDSHSNRSLHVRFTRYVRSVRSFSKRSFVGPLPHPSPELISDVPEILNRIYFVLRKDTRRQAIGIALGTRYVE